MVDATVTEYSLSRLYPGSVYTVQLQAEDGKGGYGAVVSTEFTTGNGCKVPLPSWCSANRELKFSSVLLLRHPEVSLPD